MSREPMMRIDHDEDQDEDETRLADLLIKNVLPPFEKELTLQSLIVYQIDGEEKKCLLINRSLEKNIKVPQQQRPEQKPEVTKTTTTTTTTETGTIVNNNTTNCSRRKRKITRPTKIPQISILKPMEEADDEECQMTTLKQGKTPDVILDEARNCVIIENDNNTPDHTTDLIDMSRLLMVISGNNSSQQLQQQQQQQQQQQSILNDILASTTATQSTNNLLQCQGNLVGPLLANTLLGNFQETCSSTTSSSSPASCAVATSHEVNVPSINCTPLDLSNTMIVSKNNNTNGQQKIQSNDLYHTSSSLFLQQNSNENANTNSTTILTLQSQPNHHVSLTPTSTTSNCNSNMLPRPIRPRVAAHLTMITKNGNNTNVMHLNPPQQTPRTLPTQVTTNQSVVVTTTTPTTNTTTTQGANLMASIFNIFPTVHFPGTTLKAIPKGAMVKMPISSTPLTLGKPPPPPPPTTTTTPIPTPNNNNKIGNILTSNTMNTNNNNNKSCENGDNVACQSRRYAKSFVCNQCKSIFMSLSALCEHTFAIHKSFRCTICDAQFTQRSNLQRHSLRHVGFKPFICNICSKSYYRKDHLVRHIELSHPGANPRISITVKLSSAECLDFLERNPPVTGETGGRQHQEQEDQPPVHNTLNVNMHQKHGNLMSEEDEDDEDDEEDDDDDEEEENRIKMMKIDEDSVVVVVNSSNNTKTNQANNTTTTTTANNNAVKLDSC